MLAVYTKNIVKPSKPRFYKQEKPESCVPACLRMVLSGFGLDLSEADLRARCDCTHLGTDALKAVDATRQLGFAKTAKQTLSIAELEMTIANGLWPIVFVDLRPIDGIYQPHALVVTRISDSEVEVYDPAKGEVLLPRQTFIVAWAMRHNLALLVEL